MVLQELTLAEIVGAAKKLIKEMDDSPACWKAKQPVYNAKAELIAAIVKADKILDNRR